MDASSSSDVDSIMSDAQNPATPVSSPPPDASPTADEAVDDALRREEEQARRYNLEAEQKRRKALAQKRSRKKKAETKAEREAKARELDELLKKSAAFSDILTKKTQVLGRVGSSLDGKALGEHGLQMAKQPKCLVGGTMREYQLEGLTWMYEICAQGMSGILADEMGLGKLACPVLHIAVWLTRGRKNGPDHFSHRSFAGARKLSRPAPHRRTA